MEARSRHNEQHGPGWETLPEAKRHRQQIAQVNRQRRVWNGLKLPWVNIGVSGGLGPKSNLVPIIPIGFGETIARAPFELFGHLKTGGAASMVNPPPPFVAVPELGSCGSSEGMPGCSGWR